MAVPLYQSVERACGADDRIVWVDDAARAEWEPRLERIRSALLTVRLAELAEGDPGAALLDCRFDRLPGLLGALAGAGPGARPAVTRYRVLATATVAGMMAGRGQVTSLACQLGTGRTHQLRVHLAGLGTPILGDPTYGSTAELSRAVELERPFLHAAAIALDHPVTGARLELYEPLPAELQAALERSGLPTPTPSELNEGWDDPTPAP